MMQYRIGRLLLPARYRRAFTLSRELDPAGIRPT
jgi:hypothetical protein